MMEFLKSVDRLLGRVLRTFCVANMLALTVVLGAVVFIRFFPVAKLSWSDEIIEWLMASLVFMAAAELWRQSDHFRIEALAEYVSGTLFGRVFAFVIEILTAVFIYFFAMYSLDLTLAVGRTSPILAWPMTWWYAPMPLAGFIMLAYSLRNIVQGFRRIVSPEIVSGEGDRTP